MLIKIAIISALIVFIFKILKVPSAKNHSTQSHVNKEGDIIDAEYKIVDDEK